MPLLAACRHHDPKQYDPRHPTSKSKPERSQAIPFVMSIPHSDHPTEARSFALKRVLTIIHYLTDAPPKQSPLRLLFLKDINTPLHPPTTSSSQLACSKAQSLGSTPFSLTRKTGRSCGFAEENSGRRKVAELPRRQW